MAKKKKKPRNIDLGWDLVDERINIRRHDFASEPLFITAQQIKDYTRGLEPRNMSYQIKREDRPTLFKDLGLFMLPIQYREYVILKGESFFDLPAIDTKPVNYDTSLDFSLESSRYGVSEMQHLDFAYATSLLRTYMGDASLQLAIRGRKYTPEFKFKAGGHRLTANSIITEVDAGYEGRDQIILVEAKNARQKNFNIRQLYYPFRLWSKVTDKPIHLFYYQINRGVYSFWKIKFGDLEDFHSICVVDKAKFRIVDGLYV